LKIALGTAQFGSVYGITNVLGRPSGNEVRHILTIAHKFGIDMLDTAISYGESERILGNNGIRDYKVVTKLPRIPQNVGNLVNWVKHEVQESLFRLKQESIYALLIHDPRDLTGKYGPELRKILEDLKHSGLFKKIGVSIYSPNELERIIGVLHIDLVQAPLNILDQRLISTGWIYRLKKLQIEVHARSVFLQGLLLVKPENMIPKFHRWNKIWNLWHDWLKDNKLEALDVALSFTLSIPEIDRVIVGIQSSGQLMQILESTRIKKIDKFPQFLIEDQELLHPYLW